MAVLSALPSFRGNASLSTFAMAIAWKTLLERRRKSLRKLSSSQRAQLLERPNLANRTSTPHESYLGARRRQAIINLVASLPQHQREVLALRHFNDWSLIEIAEHLEVPRDTIKSRLRAAHHQLRRLVQDNPAVGELLQL